MVDRLDELLTLMVISKKEVVSETGQPLFISYIRSDAKLDDSVLTGVGDVLQLPKRYA
jgi:hypothetical protein